MQCWRDISNTNNLFHLQIFPNFGHNISNTNLYVTKCIFPHLRPKGAQTTSNLHITPSVGMIYPILAYIFDLQIFQNCGQNISNTNLYVKKCIFPTPAPEGCTDNLQLTYITPSVGRIYLIPTYIFNLQIYPNVGQNISDKKIILQDVYFPPLCPKGAQTTSNLHISPQVLA